MNEIPRGQHDAQERKGNGEGQQEQPQNRRRGESEETARGGGFPEGREDSSARSRAPKGSHREGHLKPPTPVVGSWVASPVKD